MVWEMGEMWEMLVVGGVEVMRVVGAVPFAAQSANCRAAKFVARWLGWRLRGLVAESVDLAGRRRPGCPSASPTAKPK